MTGYVIRRAPSDRPGFTLDLTPEDWMKDALCAQIGGNDWRQRLRRTT